MRYLVIGCVHFGWLPQPFLDIELAQQRGLQEDGLEQGMLHPLNFMMIVAASGEEWAYRHRQRKSQGNDVAKSEQW